MVAHFLDTQWTIIFSNFLAELTTFPTSQTFPQNLLTDISLFFQAILVVLTLFLVFFSHQRFDFDNHFFQNHSQFFSIFNQHFSFWLWGEGAFSMIFLFFFSFSNNNFIQNSQLFKTLDLSNFKKEQGNGKHFSYLLLQKSHVWLRGKLVLGN